MKKERRTIPYVPKNLEQTPQWVCWTQPRRKPEETRRKKVAIRVSVLLNPPARTGLPLKPEEKLYADPQNPAAWLSYSEATRYYGAGYTSAGDMKKNPGRAESWRRIVKGVGFVFTPLDPFVGIDLDNCVRRGKIDDWANEVIESIDFLRRVFAERKGNPHHRHWSTTRVPHTQDAARRRRTG